jgi:hypothetical protein
MKTFYLFILAICIMQNTKAQFTTAMSYNLALPQGKMADNIKAIHQFRVEGGYTLPFFKNLNIGTEIGAGNYAYLSVPTTFNFGNGNPTKTNVNYSSNTLQLNGVAKLNIVKVMNFTPYLVVKGGYQKWYSNIYVEDPSDLDGCKPLEQKTILKDRTSTVSYGGGIKYELKNNSNCNNVNFKSYIDLQVTSVRGGTLDYINTKKLKEHDHNASTPIPSNEGKPLELKFINVQSNVVHNHMVAEMFTSKLRLIDIKIGYHIAF